MSNPSANEPERVELEEIIELVDERIQVRLDSELGKRLDFFGPCKLIFWDEDNDRDQFEPALLEDVFGPQRRDLHELFCWDEDNS